MPRFDQEIGGFTEIVFYSFGMADDPGVHGGTGVPASIVHAVPSHILDAVTSVTCFSSTTICADLGQNYVGSQASMGELEKNLLGTWLAVRNPRMKHLVDLPHQVYSRNRFLK